MITLTDALLSTQATYAFEQKLCKLRFQSTTLVGSVLPRKEAEECVSTTAKLAVSWLPQTPVKNVISAQQNAIAIYIISSKSYTQGCVAVKA